jgi:hypothetical protein
MQNLLCAYPVAAVLVGLLSNALFRLECKGVVLGSPAGYLWR